MPHARGGMACSARPWHVRAHKRERRLNRAPIAVIGQTPIKWGGETDAFVRRIWRAAFTGSSRNCRRDARRHSNRNHNRPDHALQRRGGGGGGGGGGGEGAGGRRR